MGACINQKPKTKGKVNGLDQNDSKVMKSKIGLNKSGESPRKTTLPDHNKQNNDQPHNTNKRGRRRINGE